MCMRSKASKPSVGDIMLKNNIEEKKKLTNNYGPSYDKRNYCYYLINIKHQKLA